MNYRRYDLGFVPTADQAIKIERVRSLTGRPIKDCVQALISEEWGVVDAVVDLRADDKKSTVKTHTVPNSVTVQIVLAAGHHPKHVAVVRRDGQTLAMYPGSSRFFRNCRQKSGMPASVRWANFSFLAICAAAIGCGA